MFLKIILNGYELYLLNPIMKFIIVVMSFFLPVQYAPEFMMNLFSTFEEYQKILITDMNFIKLSETGHRYLLQENDRICSMQ